MDVRFLETLIVVADCGSIAEAARRLNLTPAAVTQRLRRLEYDLGHSLVIRAGRTIQPNSAGLAVLDHARVVVDSARDLRAIAANGQPAGQLRLGATGTSMTGLLPSIIERLSSRYPAVEYFVQPGSSFDLYHGVANGDMDAAIIVRPPFTFSKSLCWQTVRREKLVYLAPKAFPEGDPHQEISRHPFIRYDRNQWGGRIVDKYLLDNDLKVQEWLELDALDAIAAHVDRGLGVSIVPDWTAPWPEGLRLRKVPLASSEARSIGVIWKRGGARYPAVAALVQVCGELWT